MQNKNKFLSLFLISFLINSSLVKCWDYSTFQSLDEQIKIMDKICSIKFLRNSSFLKKYAIELGVGSLLLGAIIYKNLNRKIRNNIIKNKNYIIAFENDQNLQEFYTFARTLGESISFGYKVAIELQNSLTENELENLLKSENIKFRNFYPTNSIKEEILKDNFENQMSAQAIYHQETIDMVKKYAMQQTNLQVAEQAQPQISETPVLKTEIQEPAKPQEIPVASPEPVATIANVVNEPVKVSEPLKVEQANYKRIIVEFITRDEMFAFKDALESLNLGKIELVDCNNKYFAIFELNKPNTKNEIEAIFAANKIMYSNINFEHDSKFKRIPLLIRVDCELNPKNIEQMFDAKFYGMASQLQPPFIQKGFDVFYFDLNSDGLTINEIKQKIKHQKEYIKLYVEQLFLNLDN